MDKVERFLDYCYYIFLIGTFVALVFGVVVLIRQQDSMWYYLLFGFLAYLGVIYILVRTLLIIKKIRQ